MTRQLSSAEAIVSATKATIAAVYLQPQSRQQNLFFSFRPENAPSPGLKPFDLPKINIGDLFSWLLDVASSSLTSHVLLQRSQR
jgi:hypothetical protein